MKVGVIRSLTDSITHSEVAAIVDSAISQLVELGGEVTNVEILEIESGIKFVFPILISEVSHYHKEWFPEWTEDYAPGTAINLRKGFKLPAVDYIEALEKKKAFAKKVKKAFDKVDVLICPTSPSLATEQDPSFEDTTYNFTQRMNPFNASGHPAIAVSVGLTFLQKLPIGIQFIGRHFDEATIYRAADAFQTALGRFKRPHL